jgi:serine/threonine protein phosphatase PrpC
MEDEFIVVGGGRFSAVYDGHGGGGVSQYLRDHLHIILSQQLEQQKKNMSKKIRSFMFGKGKNKQGAADDDKSKDNDMNLEPKCDLSGMGDLPVSAIVNALKDSFDQVDREILANDEYEYQGSTAVAVLLHEANDGVRTILSANIGDSRSILARDGRAIDLTRDHKPNDDKEKARILAMGEKIEWDHYCKVHRVRNLSLSRAVGDRFAKPAVSGEVEIQRFPVNDDRDDFILLASDGLWDVMTSQEVVSYVQKRMTAAPKDGADIKTEEDMQSLKYLRRKNMSRFIANEALRRGSGDNISVVIVWLKPF